MGYRGPRQCRPRERQALCVYSTSSRGAIGSGLSTHRTRASSSYRAPTASRSSPSGPTRASCLQRSKHRPSSWPPESGRPDRRLSQLRRQERRPPEPTVRTRPVSRGNRRRYPAKPVPTRLRHVASMNPASAVKTRTLVLAEREQPPTGRMLMLLGGRRWAEPVTEQPEFETTRYGASSTPPTTSIPSTCTLSEFADPRSAALGCRTPCCDWADALSRKALSASTVGSRIEGHCSRACGQHYADHRTLRRLPRPLREALPQPRARRKRDDAALRGRGALDDPCHAAQGLSAAYRMGRHPLVAPVAERVAGAVASRGVAMTVVRRGTPAVDPARAAAVEAVGQGLAAVGHVAVTIKVAPPGRSSRTTCTSTRRPPCKGRSRRSAGCTRYCRSRNSCALRASGLRTGGLFRPDGDTLDRKERLARLDELPMAA